MDWRAIDERLLRGLYDLDLPSFLTEGLTHVATKGGLWLLACLALLVFGRGLTRRTGAALAVGLLVHVALVEGALKHVVARQRPFAALGLTLRDSLVDPATYSFPSGHSTASFLGAWILGARFPRWRVPLLVLAGLVAASRVQLGAHYPSDVLVGGVVGILLGMVLVRALRIAPDTPPSNASA